MDTNRLMQLTIALDKLENDSSSLTEEEIQVLKDDGIDFLVQKDNKMNTVMMECGHSANAKDSNGNPVCVICFGINDDATRIAETPNLKNRKAKCVYCTKEVDSNPSLAFFSYQPQKQKDSFFCGCMGWD